MKKGLIISTCIISAIIFLFCSCSEYGTSVQIIDDNASLSINDDDFSRIKYINSIEEYEAVLLSKANGAIDFDNEMVVVYSFEDINQRELKIQSVSVSDDFAEIGLAHKKRLSCVNIGDTCAPYQRYVIIKVSKSIANNVLITVD